MTSDEKNWETFAGWFLDKARSSKAGRSALRRRWSMLRSLAQEVVPKISDAETMALLGKVRSELDPEANDVKAIIAYAAGRGLLSDPSRLADALSADELADPLAFLATLSGKSFGETWAPEIAKYWLCGPDDRWVKQSSKQFYDAGWFPIELDRGSDQGIRIELKASSEHPEYRFQQIRHHHLSGGADDYDVLLCLGVTAGELEWWVIPVHLLDVLAENGVTHSDDVLITRHHGKRRPIWNDNFGYKDEGWFVANEAARTALANCYVQSAGLRQKLLGGRLSR